MNKIACLLVAVSLCGTCFAQNANTTPVGANTKTVTITGTIKNFDEFKAVVVPETYIQLVPISADGGIVNEWDSKGIFTYKSDLPKLSVPKNAAFSFTVQNIPLGKYILAAQRLYSTSLGRTHCFVTAKEQAIFIIELTADSQSPHTINAVDLIVWTH